jgi:hypothetical protein
MSYDYDRRTAAVSATPVLDKLFHDHARVTSAMEPLIKRLHAAADKAEKLVKLNDEDPAVLQVASAAAEIAYKLFEPFRPFLSSWRKEVEQIQVPYLGKIVHEMENLAHQLGDLNSAYSYTLEEVHKVPRYMDKVTTHLHDLAIAASSLKTVYGQYASEYLRVSSGLG